MSEAILITGAAGFAGSHLLDLLEPAGTPIVAWRRPGEPLPAPHATSQAEQYRRKRVQLAGRRSGHNH